MSDHDNKQVIVIKRITKKGGHHGGGWKIAYADFMTAMMAFFMLLWLLSMLNKFQLQGISNYFKRPMTDLFMENQLHNSIIPKVQTEHTEKSELAPRTGRKLGHSQIKNTLIKTNKSENDAAQTNSENIGITKSSQHNAGIKGIINPKKDIAQSITGGPSIDEAQKEGYPAPGKSSNETEKKELDNLKKAIEASLQHDPDLNQYQDHLNFQVTQDGLKINLYSLENQPMFTTGKTDFAHYATKIVTWLAKELNKTPRKITIIGHTDTEPYNQSSTNYSNWELSADRANATRRYLLKNGLPADKVIRVQGASSENLLIKKDGSHPANRRIEIIVLSDEALKHMLAQ